MRVLFPPLQWKPCFCDFFVPECFQNGPFEEKERNNDREGGRAAIEGEDVWERRSHDTKWIRSGLCFWLPHITFRRQHHLLRSDLHADEAKQPRGVGFIMSTLTKLDEPSSQLSVFVSVPTPAGGLRSAPVSNQPRLYVGLLRPHRQIVLPSVL